MKLKNSVRLTSLFMATAMAAGSLFGAPPAQQQQQYGVTLDRNFHAEASQLLQEIRSSAARLDREAGTLESYTRAGLSWETHASQLTTTKEHINAIGKRLDRLQAIRHAALPWHQQAIDSIMPSAVAVASNTSTAIQHLNENRRYLWAPDYTDHLKTIAEHADRLNKFVNLHLELNSAREKLDELRIQSGSIGS